MKKGQKNPENRKSISIFKQATYISREHTYLHNHVGTGKILLIMMHAYTISFQINMLFYSGPYPVEMGERE